MKKFTRIFVFAILLSCFLSAFLTGNVFAITFSLCGPSGGVGGAEFSDGQRGGRTIVEVRVRSGALIDSIQVVYRDITGLVGKGAMHGRSGGNLSVFKLGPGEYITVVGGKYGKFIDSLYIKTNKGRHQKWGGQGGNIQFIYTAPPGSRIDGFFGRAGKYLDSIGVIMRTP